MALKADVPVAACVGTGERAGEAVWWPQTMADHDRKMQAPAPDNTADDDAGAEAPDHGAGSEAGVADPDLPLIREDLLAQLEAVLLDLEHRPDDIELLDSADTTTLEMRDAWF